MTSGMSCASQPTPLLSQESSLTLNSPNTVQCRRARYTYKGTRFFNGDRALVVKRWLHRLDEDASGLTFEEWNPAQAVGTSQEPAPMIINSSQLRAAGFKLDKVIPPQLEAAARSGMRTRGSGLRQLRGMGSESGQKGNFPEFSVR